MRYIFMLILVVSCNTRSKNSPEGPLFNSTDEGAAIISGYLEVPENRNLKNGKTLQLAYTVLKANGASPKKDPIVYLQGGPGVSTLIMRQFWENNILRKERDIVLMDQRGTGLSNAICNDIGGELIDILGKDLNIEGEYAEIKKLLVRCKKEVSAKNIDLSAYNSRENAADFETLRKFLNYDQWNIYGGSYGSRLGLTIMRDFPKSVRSAIIFGVFAPESDLYKHLVTNFRHALFGTFKACRDNPECDRRYPDLKEEFINTAERLAQTPYAFNFDGGPWIMNAQDFLLVLHQMLYNKATIGQIPSFIKAINSGNNDIIRNALAPTINVSQLVNIAMYMSVNAYEELPFNDADSLLEDLKKNPEIITLPAFFASDPELLAEWHSYRAASYENEAVISDIPTLLANGNLDPITPPANAVAAAKSLSNSFYISFEYEGHNLFNPCFFEISKAFLDKPEELPNLDCVKDIPGISWNL